MLVLSLSKLVAKESQDLRFCLVVKFNIIARNLTLRRKNKSVSKILEVAKEVHQNAIKM